MKCDWNNPGINPYKGSLLDALKTYGLTKHEIDSTIYKVNRSDFDALVYINKDSIRAPYGKATDLKNMHWGKSTMCEGFVNRSSWDISREEPATVYCYAGNKCIAIPKVCGNISQITYTRTELKEPELFFYTETNKVPEISSIYLVLVALILLCLSRIKH